MELNETHNAHFNVEVSIFFVKAPGFATSLVWFVFLSLVLQWVWPRLLCTAAETPPFIMPNNSSMLPQNAFQALYPSLTTQCTPEYMHEMPLGVFKHMLSWLVKLITQNMADAEGVIWPLTSYLCVCSYRIILGPHLCL